MFQQQERYARVDSKAATHLSAITVLFAAIGFFCKWIIGSLVPPHSFLEWTIAISGAASVVAVLVAWLSFFRVFRQHRIEFLRLDEEYIEFCQKNLRVNVNYYIAKRSAEAFLSLKDLTHRKTDLIATGYRATIVAMAILVFLGCAYATHQWVGNSVAQVNYKREDRTMVENKNSSTNSNGDAESAPTPEASSTPNGGYDSEPQSTSQPDTSIEGPSNIYLTESYDPENLATRDSGDGGEEDSGDSSQK